MVRVTNDNSAKEVARISFSGQNVALSSGQTTRLLVNIILILTGFEDNSSFV